MSYSFFIRFGTIGVHDCQESYNGELSVTELNGGRGEGDGIREKEEEVLRVAGCALPCNLLRPSSADR